VHCKSGFSRDRSPKPAQCRIAFIGLQKSGSPPTCGRSRSIQMRAHRFVDLGRPGTKPGT